MAKPSSSWASSCVSGACGSSAAAGSARLIAPQTTPNVASKARLIFVSIALSLRDHPACVRQHDRPEVPTPELDAPWITMQLRTARARLFGVTHCTPRGRSLLPHACRFALSPRDPYLRPVASPPAGARPTLFLALLMSFLGITGVAHAYLI